MDVPVLLCRTSLLGHGRDSLGGGHDVVEELGDDSADRVYTRGSGPAARPTRRLQQRGEQQVDGSRGAAKGRRCS